MSALLEIEHLEVTVPVEGEDRTVLHDVSLAIEGGVSLGLVGESGSGKSMTARTVGRTLPRGAAVSGAVRFDGAEVASLRGADLKRYRSEVAMIFQDPRAHINPVRRIGDFMTEALRLQGVSGERAGRQAVAALGDVGIDDGERRLRQYPHELSGGLLQRVMIATALLTEPRLLLADEPTTALDVTSQAEVMAILDELRRERELAVLFITHDLDLATAVCDRIAVMYAGSIVEFGRAESLRDDPVHPYSAALAAARPSIGRPQRRLVAVPGRPVSAFEAPAGCPFSPRCPHVEERCTLRLPELRRMGDGFARCVRAEEITHV